MDVWRFMQVLLIVGVVSASRNSDPMDHSPFTIFDESLHVPGEPLCPLDFQNAAAVNDDTPPLNDGDQKDPIELAGLYEGDIILSTTRTLNETQNQSRNGIIYEKQKWTGGVVPYFISSDFNAVERSVIAKAIGQYHSRTCIRFVPRASQADYIHITKGNGCSSHVGRTGGAQPVTLGNGCVFTGIAIHELMHAVGFWHEQSRWDRDDYVNVYFQNIQAGMEFNFRKYNWDYIQNLSAPYDLGSVMHYSSYSFSKDRRSATILPKDPNQKIGQRNDFSATDLYKINKLYKCGTNGGPATTPAPKPTNRPPVEKCDDTHKHCSYWASKGECSKNGAWMMVNCKKSCNQCKKPCRDLNAQCGVWARKGDCSKTSQRDYMKAYCTKSCRSCRNGDNEPQLTTPSVLPTNVPTSLPWVPPTSNSGTTTPNPHLDCEDKEKFCSYWASKGECTKNPKFMGKYCPKSCKICM